MKAMTTGSPRRLARWTRRPRSSRSAKSGRGMPGGRRLPTKPVAVGAASSSRGARASARTAITASKPAPRATRKARRPRGPMPTSVGRMRRAVVLAACVVLVVGGFLIARGAKDDGASSDSSSGTTTQTTATQTGAQQATATTSTATTPTAKASPAVQSFRISVQNGKAVGGQRTLKVKKGDRVRIIVTSDVAAEAHLHGYEIEKELAKDTPTVFALEADIDGVFRLELHTEPEQVLAELQVAP